MGIFERKTKVTVDQLAEGVVIIPHTPNPFNKAALDFLTDTFQAEAEEKRFAVEVEYNVLSFAVWWFRYRDYFEQNHKEKASSFNNKVVHYLNSYFPKVYKDEFLEYITKIYDARTQSYGKAYYSSDPLEHMVSVFLHYMQCHIAMQYRNSKISFIQPPVDIPVKWLIPDLERKMACSALIVDLWEFTHEHMKGWKIV